MNTTEHQKDLLQKIEEEAITSKVYAYGANKGLVSAFSTGMHLVTKSEKGCRIFSMSPTETKPIETEQWVAEKAFEAFEKKFKNSYR